MRIPLSILVPLLESYIHPSPLLVSQSDARKKCLYITDNVASKAFDQLYYEVKTNILYDVSAGWEDFLEDFCLKKNGYREEFEKTHPNLFKNGQARMICVTKVTNPNEEEEDEQNYEVHKKNRRQRRKETSERRSREDPEEHADYWDKVQSQDMTTDQKWEDVMNQSLR